MSAASKPKRHNVIRSATDPRAAIRDAHGDPKVVVVSVSHATLPVPKFSYAELALKTSVVWDRRFRPTGEWSRPAAAPAAYRPNVLARPSAISRGGQRIVSRATIYKLIDSGELPAHKIGTRTTVVLHEDWLAWLRSRPNARPISATE